jgi:hypothetical protein
VWALWDQLQLQQKKIDALTEGVDKIAEGMRGRTTAEAPDESTGSLASAPHTPPTASGGLACRCAPPSMCDGCMSALERAGVSPAYLTKANPLYTSRVQKASFPTTSFVATEGREVPLGGEYPASVRATQRTTSSRAHSPAARDPASAYAPSSTIGPTPSASSFALAAPFEPLLEEECATIGASDAVTPANSADAGPTGTNPRPPA